MDFKISVFLNWLRRNIAVVGIILTFCIYTVPEYAKIVEAPSSPSGWTMVDIWLKSAECARETRKLLVVCRDGKLIPIADAAGGDDPGHALTLGIIAAITQNPPAASQVPIINSTLNYLGLTVLAILFLHLKLPVISFIVLTLGTTIDAQHHLISPHPAQLGAVCLAAILPLALLGIPTVSASRKTICVWLALGLIGIAIATIFRQAIGLMGLVAAASSIVVRQLAVKSFTARRSFLSIALLVCAILAYQAPSFLLQTRDAVYNLSPGKNLGQHGPWHNLYIGLGVVNNPFGIEWSDTFGYKTGQRIDPNSGYLTYRYYAVLRDEYFRILIHHPINVAIIYLKKTSLLLGIRFDEWQLGSILFALIVGGAFARGLLFPGRLFERSSDASLFVGFLFTAFFMGQAVLFNVLMAYLFSIVLFLWIIVGSILELCRRPIVEYSKSNAATIGAPIQPTLQPKS